MAEIEMTETVAEGNYAEEQGTAQPAAPVAAAKGGPSLLDELTAEVKRDLYAEHLFAPVPLRPGWEVEYRVDMPREVLVDANERATPKVWGKATGPTNEEHASGFILLAQCAGIWRVREGGTRQQVRDRDGDPLTFTSLEFIDAFGTGEDRDALSAVQAFLGPSLSAQGAALLDAAGYAGADSVLLDPRSA